MSEKKDFFNVEDFIGKAIKIYKKEGGKSMEDYFYNQRKETFSLMSKTMLQSMEQILLNIKDHYDNNKDKYIDYLIKDNKTNTSYITTKDKGKEAILEYEAISYHENLSLVKINLITGRSHQIRAQFSHHSHPLIV